MDIKLETPINSFKLKKEETLFSVVKTKNLNKATLNGNVLAIANKKRGEQYLITNKGLNTLTIDKDYYINHNNFFTKNITTLSKLSNKPSFVVVADNDRLINATKPELVDNGYKILYIDMQNPDRSHKFNPTKDIYRDYSALIKQKESTNEALETMSTRIENFVASLASFGSSPFEIIAKNIFEAYMLAMLEDEDYSLGTYNLENFYKLAYYKDLKSENTYAKIQKFFEDKSPIVKTKIQEFMDLNNQGKCCCYQIFLDKIAFLKDKAIHRFLAKGHLDVKELRDSPVAVFVRHYKGDNPFNKFINILLEYIMTNLFDAFDNSPTAQNRQVHIFIENLLTTGKLNILNQLLILGRIWAFSVHLLASSYEDIRAVYLDEYDKIVEYANIQLLFDTQDKSVKEYFLKYTELKYKSNRFGIKGASSANIHYYNLDKPKDKILVKFRNNQTTISNWDV